MKKILIIGAQGMLGQELVKFFKKDSGYKVVAWDRKDIDVTKEKEVSKKISVVKPTIIINATGYNALDKCEADKKEYQLAKGLNGLAPGYLAKAARKNKAILVHYSTDHVFSGEPVISEPQGCSHSCANCGLHEGFTPQIGFNENDKPKPVNKYGKTKLMGEKAVQKNTKNYYLIRLSKLFGNPGLNESAKRSFFDVILEAAKKNSEVNGVDEETSCFTYAPDLAKKTKEIIDDQKPFGIYHVINSGPATWYEGAKEIYGLLGIKTKLTPVSGDEFPRPAKRPFYSVLINTKLNPLRDYREALQEYLKIKK
jgi:dTDP-4-dehydrorhamnose reductase